MGAAEVLSFDWCIHTGKALGGNMLANVCNDNNVLLASLVTKSEKIEEIVPMLQEIAARPNVTARVAVIDKVPPSLDEDAISKLALTIMEALPMVEKVMQDRFHVGHHVSKHFNNADARFYALVIHGWREATVTRDSKFESAVDEALRAGTISKQRKHKGVRLGQKLNDEEIRQLKASGEYHNLFSAKECIVPEIVKDADTLRLSVARWKTMIIDACFHPPDADGKRCPASSLSPKTLLLNWGTFQRMGSSRPPPAPSGANGSGVFVAKELELAAQAGERQALGGIQGHPRLITNQPGQLP